MLSRSEFELMRVGAVVELAQSDAERPLVRARVELSNDERLVVQARAFAEGSDGRRIAPGRAHIELALWRRGVGAIVKRYTGPPLPEGPEEQLRVLGTYRVQLQDIEDALNQLFGRDPEQEPPPRLSWGSLMKTLHEAGIDISEDELVAAPFVFEFSDELLAEVDAA
jgi:hypothetical protein